MSAPAEFLTHAALDGVTHGFFTRRGGVSAGAFGTLNCSLNGRDDATLVAENRARAMRALGVQPDALFGLHQVHGAAVAVLDDAGWAEAARPQADGIVTRRRGVALGIVTADCGPLLFADAEAGVIGACHAGWRGAVLGVMEATVAAMCGLGARPERVVAVLGPCIHQPSYEVGSDMRDQVLARAADDVRFFMVGGREAKWRFDLPGYCLARLHALRLRAVAGLGADTYADAQRFFSYRRATHDGTLPIGHQLSAIALLG
jgi:YfiH family protein